MVGAVNQVKVAEVSDEESYASLDHYTGSSRDGNSTEGVSSDSDNSHSPRQRGWLACRACKDLLDSDPNALAAVAVFAWFCNGLFVYTQRPWGEEKEPYTFIEAVYVMAQIITTVGYGDQVPVCPRGMLYTCFNILFAILVLSSLVTALTDHVLKRQQNAMENAIKTSFGVGNKSPKGEGDSPAGGGSARSRRVTGGSPNSSRDYDKITRGDTSVSRVELPAGWRTLLASLGIWLFCVLAGSMFMYFHPKELPETDGVVRGIQALYFSIITLTTVGFGDIVPQTQMGKLFSTFWMFFGVTAFANLVSSFSALWITRRSSKRLGSGDRQNEILKAMDRDGDEKVGKTEFLAYMLHKHGIGETVGVDALCEIIQVIAAEFEVLDKDGDGELDVRELSRFDDDFLVRHKTGVGEQLGRQLEQLVDAQQDR